MRQLPKKASLREFWSKRPTSPIVGFLGGQSTLFVLLCVLFIGLIVMVFTQVSFIFYPIRVFFSTVVLPVVLATILYYLLRPILRVLEERLRIPRVYGILIILLATAGLLTLVIFLVLPFLRMQTINLFDEFPSYFKQLILEIDYFFRNSVFAPIYEGFNFNVNTFIDSSFDSIGKFFTETLGGIASGVTSFISAFTGFILSLFTVPLILFYLLKDGEKLPQMFLRMMPPRIRKGAAIIFRDADKQISAYIQGQILVAIAIGIMVSIGFLIIDMKYALLLGVLAMFTSIVPYLGPVIAITPAAIIAVVTSPFMLVKLAIVWTIVQVVEGKFISPQIMGKSLHIHPITIIFVLLTAGSLFGVAGVILGIPGYALLKVVATHIFYLFTLRYNRFETEEDMYYDTIENYYDDKE